MRARYLIHIYFSHWKKNLAVYIFFAFAIAIPILVNSFFSDMIDVSMKSFIEQRVISGDILIESSGMDNYYHFYSYLPYDAETVVAKAIDSVLPQGNSAEYTTYYLLEEKEGISYLYEDLQEAGEATSIIASDSIPQGYFVSDPSLKLPDRIYIVSSKYQGFKELKKYNEEIIYPRSFQFKIAISQKDSSSLLLPARSSFIVVNLEDGIDDTTITAIVNKLREDDRLQAFSIHDDLSFIEITRRLITPILYNHNGLANLTYRSSAAASGFHIIFISSIFFIAFYSYRYRKNEYRLYRLIGMKKERLLSQMIAECLSDWTIGTIGAFILIGLAKLSMYLFTAPHVPIDSSKILYFDEVYTIDGIFQISPEMSEIMVLALVYLGVYLISYFLVQIGRREE